MFDLGSIVFGLDATPTQEGARQVVAAVESVDKVTRKATASTESARREQEAWAKSARNLSAVFDRTAPEIEKSARQMALGLTRGLRTQFARDQADIKESVLRGFLTPQEAEARGRQAAQQFNRGLVQVLDQQGAGGGLQGAQGQRVFVALAGQSKTIKDLGAASTGATGGVGNLTRSMASLAANSIGVRAGLGPMISTLGTLAVGSVVTLGIVAGVAAISAGIKLLGKESKEAEERIKKLIDEANQLRTSNQSSLLTAQQALDETTNKRFVLQRQLDAATRTETVSTPAGSFTATVGGTEKILRLRRELDALGVKEIEQRKVLSRALEDDAKATAKLGREQVNVANERASQVEALRKAELDGALAVAKAQKDVRTEQALRFQEGLDAIDRQVKAATRLTAAEKERLRTAETQVLAAQQFADAQERALKAIERSRAIATPAQSTFGPLGSSGLNEEFRRRLDEIERTLIAGRLFGVTNGAGVLTADEQASQRRNGFLGTRDLESFAKSGKGLGEFLVALDKSKKDLAAEEAARQKQIRALQDGAFQVIAFGQALAQITGSQTLGRAFGGAAQGAALGSAVAPGVGTIVGGAVGFVGGLFGGGGGRNARKEAQRDIDAFVADLRRAQLGPLEQALGGLTDRFTALRDEAQKTGASFIAATTAFAVERARIQREFEAGQVAIRGGFQAEALRLGGNDAGARTLELQLRNAAELADALKQGFTGTTQLALKEVQALRELALARELDIEAMQNAAKLLSDEASLAAREAGLQGRTADRVRLEAEAQRIQALSQAETLKAQGDITEDFFQRLVNVINGEAKGAVDAFTDSIRAQADAQRKAADDLRQAEQDASGSLQVRLLRATGRSGEAEALQEQQRRDAELADAIAKGFSESFINELKKVQGFEATPTSDPLLRFSGSGSVADSRTTSVTAITSAQGDTIGSLMFTSVTLQRDLRDDVRAILSIARSGSRTGPALDSGTIGLGADAAAGARLGLINSAFGVRPVA